MAIPTYGQRKQYAKQLSKYLGAAGATFRNYQTPSNSKGQRVSIIFGPSTDMSHISDDFHSIGKNHFQSISPASSTKFPSMNKNMASSFAYLARCEARYKARTDSITSMMLETINESKCDSCLLHVFFLDGYTTMFNIHQSRGSNNVNIASIDSLEVCSTSYLGVYSEYSTEPQYGIKVECYKTGEPVSKEKVEELADRVARFLKFYKFVMESPHYNFPMLTVPPHLINSTPKQ